jgi:phage tail sheath protein FI
MAEYLAPGVYIEEIEVGAKPIEGVSTSTAGFLGQTERGPVEPRLATSLEQFLRLYGGYIEDSYLAYAVEGFFRNGGTRCFIGRITAKDASTATLTLNKDKDEKSNGTEIIKVSALGPGDWGNRIKISVMGGSLTSDNRSLFKLTVNYYKTDADAKSKAEPYISELYDNLSADPNASDYYLKRINGISSLVSLERLADGMPDAADAIMKGDPNSAGSNSVSVADFEGESTSPEKRRGLSAFKGIDEISIICAPDEVRSGLEALADSLRTHCEFLKDRFAILQSRQSAMPDANLRPNDSKYTAFYYPWIYVLDPITNLPKLVPPGGHVAGIYARVDQERGVHKAPANEIIRGVTGLEFNITKDEQALLNPRGVNCIRVFTGRGIRVWGARTASSDPSWKYVNVRRLFIFLEKSIEVATQWAVFESNDEKLWARMRQTINQFLTRVWRDGALMGSTQDEAYFVKCDRTTMTQDDIDNGRLIMLIGVAPVKPAEFVIFRIAQVAKGTEISE